MSENKNLELVDALDNAPDCPPNHVPSVEANITEVGNIIRGDIIENMGRGYAKRVETIAALLCYSPIFRAFAKKSGINLALFDQMVQTARQSWQAECNKEPSGVKVCTVLRRITGV